MQAVWKNLIPIEIIKANKDMGGGEQKDNKSAE